MKRMISCILLLSSFLTPVIAQIELRSDPEKPAGYVLILGPQSKDSLKDVSIEKEKERLREATLSSPSYLKHKYMLSKASKVLEALETYRKGVVDKRTKSRIDYKQKLDVSYNSDDTVIGYYKQAQRTISQRKFNGNCLKVKIKEGQLSNTIKGIELNKYDGLKISGTLNTADIRIIRALYGAEDDADLTLRDSLLLLDLSDAKFKDDKSVYMTENATQKGMVIKQTTMLSVRCRDGRDSVIYTDSVTFAFTTMTKEEWTLLLEVLSIEQKDMYFTKGADGNYYAYHFVSSKFFPSAMMQGCKSLQCIVIPKHCKEFDQHAVFHCNNLRVIAYPPKTAIIHRHSKITNICKQYDKTFVYEP